MKNLTFATIVLCGAVVAQPAVADPETTAGVSVLAPQATEQTGTIAPSHGAGSALGALTTTQKVLLGLGIVAVIGAASGGGGGGGGTTGTSP